LGFFPEQALQEGLVRPFNPLRGVVAKLSPSAKQAMYAAAKAGILIRGKWSDTDGNGCAFNKAGEQRNRVVGSVHDAAALFDMNVEDVNNFIRKWDHLEVNLIEANRLLIQAIEDDGTHRPPRVKGRRVIRGYAFKSEATEWAEQLESGELTVDMIPGCDLVAELLGA